MPPPPLLRLWTSLALLVPASSLVVPPRAVVGRTSFPLASAPPSASPTFSGPVSDGIERKVNEIDFCISPADVSLSRAYARAQGKGGVGGGVGGSNKSMTRALNDLSNRVVRRIILSRAWPSSEALNDSLRRVLADSGKEEEEEEEEEASEGASEEASEGEAVEGQNFSSSSSLSSRKAVPKCPVPRPLLNIIMKRSAYGREDNPPASDADPPPDAADSPPDAASEASPSEESVWIDIQLRFFRNAYGEGIDYDAAEAYLECVLSLATSGIEHPRSKEVLEGGMYDGSYQRLVAVLESVGAVFVDIPPEEGGEATGRRMMEKKFVDRDLCLSMLDKMQMASPKFLPQSFEGKKEQDQKEEEIDKKEVNIIGSIADETIVSSTEPSVVEEASQPNTEETKRPNIILQFFRRGNNSQTASQDSEATETFPFVEEVAAPPVPDDPSDPYKEDDENMPRDDLGAVLLSASEPTMTRQLNALANVVCNALLFGGDQEIRVLAETLAADRAAFVRRWSPASDVGVQLLDNLVALMERCLSDGVLTELRPPLPLDSTYATAYLRLTSALVQQGSGYIRLLDLDQIRNDIPRSATEELGRFAQWETTLRQRVFSDDGTGPAYGSPDFNAYPDDLVGRWSVSDEIGGERAGTSVNVSFGPGGKVEVPPPLRGLRWRLDPGPTHLDTCTFQVMGEDGAVLQYIGFLDRGARLESRFSRRSLKITGSVMFQMRDGQAALMGKEYRRDILPVVVKTGTTRFVMIKASASLA